jgi:hypothetical protein
MKNRENTIDWFNRDNQLLLSDEALLAECSIDFFKSTGKGGQKKNKTSSAVRLIHLPTHTEAVMGNFRSQADNKKVALKQLKINLAVKWRKLPLMAWDKNIAPGASFIINEKNKLYPLLVAVLLDHLDFYDYQVSKAAESLKISTGQLIKVLKKHPTVWQVANQNRTKLGLKSLK